MHEYHNIWIEHLKIDPEYKYHNIELYKIWNEKFNFVYKSLLNNPFNSEYFMWSDIGCFRNRLGWNDFNPSIMNSGNWPCFESMEKYKGKINIVNAGLNYDEYKLDNDNFSIPEINKMKSNVVGTQFFGDKNIMIKWTKLFYELMGKYINKNIFAGKDQNIMANLCLSHKNDVNMIYPTKGDKYFYLQYYLNPI